MSRIAAIRAAAAGVRASDDADDTIEEETDDAPEAPVKSKRKERSMSDENKAALDAAKTEGRAEAFKEANERMNAVFASEHYAGREGLAAKMLGKQGMSADDIIDILAATPKADTSAMSAQQREAADEAGRKEMRDALIQSGNSDIDANDAAGKSGGKDKSAEAQQAKAGWKRAASKVNRLNGFKD